MNSCREKSGYCDGWLGATPLFCGFDPSWVDTPLQGLDKELCARWCPVERLEATLNMEAKSCLGCARGMSSCSMHAAIWGRYPTFVGCSSAVQLLFLLPLMPIWLAATSATSSTVCECCLWCWSNHHWASLRDTHAKKQAS